MTEIHMLAKIENFPVGGRNMGRSREVDPLIKLTLNIQRCHVRYSKKR
jgi:hypothetical protein